jgi:hypothetical protein
LSSVSTDPELVDATLICAPPVEDEPEGLADEGLAEEAFGFDELFEELPPHAAIERRAAASTEVWSTRCLSMVPPPHRIVPVYLQA